MVSLETLLNLLGEFDIPPSKVLPEEITSIPDDWELSTHNMAKLFHKSEITIRRWCREGKIRYLKKDPYVVKGIEVKRNLYEIHYPHIKSQFKGLDWLDENSLRRALRDMKEMSLL